MEINDIVNAIEARVENGRPDVQAQAILMSIDRDLDMTVGCVIDPTKLTYALMEDVKAFNDEATNTITFESGKILNNGSDNSLFMLMFSVSNCNGGL